MYCPNCGNQVGDSKFCPKCGENLAAALADVKAENSAEEIKPVEEITTAETESEPTTEPETIPESTPEIVLNEEPETAPEKVLETPEETTTQVKYSINEFANNNMQKNKSSETFQLESDYMLDVNLNGKVWAKLGAMVAYTGDVRFKRQSSLEQGIDKFIKKTVTGEGMHLMKMKGQGNVFLADYGKEIIILNLQNEKIYVNGNNILAFEEGIDWDIKMMTTGAMMSGGLFNIKLQGTGMVAITTHYTPLTLRVTPETPVKADPHATVAWSGGLSTSVKMDVDFKTLLGKDSEESVQMKFKGDGFVIIQPYEE
jgi:uncharacterized protein (AIM24 family)